MARGRVWRRLVVWAVAAMCCAAGSACGDGDDSEGCFIVPEENKASSAGTLVYSVSGTALAQVFKIAYTASDGIKTVDNPSLPFSVSVQLKTGDRMHMEVTGSADEGASLSAGYTFSAASMAAGNNVSAADTCQH
jgi:hypothetical protein